MAQDPNQDDPSVFPENGVEAQLVYGDIPEEDFNAQYQAMDDPSKLFADYLMRNRYEWDGCRYMLSVTSPDGFVGNTVAVCQLAEPTLLLISDWTASKIGEQPIIPDPESQDPNWVLIDAHPELFMQNVMSDGNNAVYRISGMYVYACLNPDANMVKNLVYPRPPYLKDSFQRTLNTADLMQGLINNTYTLSTGSP